MGTIMVSGQGHAAMGFSVAGANERINAGTAGRLATDTLGTMRTSLLYTASSTAYNPSGDTGGSSGRRWGDYSYTCLDPEDDMTMWTIQEYCDATNSYGVRVVRLLAPPPPRRLPSPRLFAAGRLEHQCHIDGHIGGWIGFYDPGTNFVRRIAAVIDGAGVTVNGITVNNPTNIALNLSVAPGATIGGMNVTVTNPDGQFAVSASPILTISGPATHLLTVTNIGAGTARSPAARRASTIPRFQAHLFVNGTLVTLTAAVAPTRPSWAGAAMPPARRPPASSPWTRPAPSPSNSTPTLSSTPLASRHPRRRPPTISPLRSPAPPTPRAIHHLRLPMERIRRQFEFCRHTLHRPRFAGLKNRRRQLLPRDPGPG